MRLKALVHRHRGKIRVFMNGKSSEQDEVILEDVEFFIIPELQQESREQKTRIPHAFAVGYIKNLTKQDEEEMTWEDFDYDVFKNNNFILVKSGTEIKSGKYVHLKEGLSKICAPTKLG